MKSLNNFLNEASSLGELGLSNDLIQKLYSKPSKWVDPAVKRDNIIYQEVSMKPADLKKEIEIADLMAIEDSNNVAVFKESGDPKTIVVQEYVNGVPLQSTTIKKTELAKKVKGYRKVYSLKNNFKKLKKYKQELNNTEEIKSAGFDKVVLKMMNEKKESLIKEVEQLLRNDYTYIFGANNTSDSSGTIKKVQTIGDLNLKIKKLEDNASYLNELIGVDRYQDEVSTEEYRNLITTFKNKLM